ncbi:MAG: hypothetical protein ABIX01_10040 [Chitinophagaceae bacterium]
MKPLILSIFSFCLFLSGFVAKCATITIKIVGQPVNSIRVTAPLHSNYFSRHQGITDEVYIGTDSFVINIDSPETSFFNISFNNEEALPIVLNKSDKIYITANRKSDKYVAYSFTIDGSNSAAHRIYQQFFFPAARAYSAIDHFATQKEGGKVLLKKVKVYIDSINGIWKDLISEKGCDANVCELYSTDVTSILYKHSISVLSSSYSQIDIPVDEVKTIKNTMMYYGGITSRLLLKTYYGNILYDEYLKGILRSDSTIEDSMIRSSESAYFIYYDSSFREKAWGGYLWHLRTLFPGIEMTDSNNLNLFKRYYKNSVYVEKISHYNDSIRAERAKLSTVQTIDTTYFNSLTELLNTCKNERYIFIDIWATWCLPCIDEFQYLNSLSKFLSKKHIAQVFLSVDREADRDKWMTFVKKNNIPGFHAMLNRQNQEQLLALLNSKVDESLNIPQYLFYDSEKKKFTINLPRPRTGVVLESKMNSLLE